MSIQAVRSNYIGDTDTNYSQAQRAIARWSSGEKVNPPCPWADFSADNWADSDERDPAKAPANLPPYTCQGNFPTSDLELLVNQLTAKNWKRIIDAAMPFAKKSGGVKRQVAGDNKDKKDDMKKRPTLPPGFKLRDDDDEEEELLESEDSHSEGISCG